ncbi:MAG: patatin-like phospholipase family protein [Candidatus Promineofilum sp.]|nr:patatin-like phospholipase family protein [Promineifilum sp.]MCW5865239.1 patatin-like phospholipase family protein [Anaerolineae bacterium]
MSAEQTPRPRLGLVLGGGGARGLAHIGVLRVLERERIPVACVAGTSMGGLIGALYAAGVAIERVEAEVVRLSRVTEQMRLVDFELSAAGLSVRGRRIYNMLAELLGEELTFADLRLPLAMVSVDVRTGRPVTLQGGLVIDAVRATISIPGIFTPVDLGDYRLVDGGVLDNVPVDVAHALGATHTVAVDVLPSYSRNQPGVAPVETGLQLAFAPQQFAEIYQVLMIMIAAVTEAQLRQYPPDLLIRPALSPHVTLLSGFNRADELIAAGEAAAVAALPAIRTLLAGETEAESSEGV